MTGTETEISFTGPTGFPLVVPSPGHSPHSSTTKIHYHLPLHRQLQSHH